MEPVPTVILLLSFAAPFVLGIVLALFFRYRAERAIASMEREQFIEIASAKGSMISAAYAACLSPFEFRAEADRLWENIRGGVEERRGLSKQVAHDLAYQRELEFHNKPLRPDPLIVPKTIR
jgi:hypothetical protein